MRPPLAAFGALLLSACVSPGGALPITADIDAVGWAVFDGEVFVGSGDGRATVRSKLTGAILYTVQLPGAGSVLAVRADGSDKIVAPVGTPLPAYASQPFAPGVAESYEITFEGN